MVGGGHGEGYTYGGLTFHPPKRWQARTGQALCAVMWFWIFYRAKQDGDVLLGLRHPWEHRGGHGHAHNHGHADKEKH